MRLVYTLLIFIAALPATLWLARRGQQAQDGPGRWPERYGRGPVVPGGVAVWVHAVSVGEVRAAIPLVNALLARHGDRQVAVTCLTPTGSAQIRQLWGDRVHHRYLPFDLPFAVNGALDRLQPRQLVVFETELWPNLYRAAAQRGIAIVIANARLSERSLRSYRRIGGLVREMLQQCRIAAQSEMDADRFRQLGAPRVETVGNIKFDVEVPAAQVTEGQQLRALLGSTRPVWVAASTHDGEEQAALQAHQRVLAQAPDSLLILVPRHPQRFAAVQQLIEQSGMRYSRRQAPADSGATTQVLLGDSMGEMFVYLAAADVAFVGGSLVPIGGHNVLEPAALGMPVVFGPHMQNFLAARDLLLQAQAATQITDAGTLAETVLRLLRDAEYRAGQGQRAQAAVALNRGALALLLTMLAPRPQAVEATLDG